MLHLVPVLGLFRAVLPPQVVGGRHLFREAGVLFIHSVDEQVLLIKTCWGGRSVRRDFLPPSAEMPSAEELEKGLENARKKAPKRVKPASR